MNLLLCAEEDHHVICRRGVGKVRGRDDLVRQLPENGNGRGEVTSRDLSA